MGNNIKLLFFLLLIAGYSIANAQLKHYRLAQIPIGNSDFNGFATIDIDLFSFDIGAGLSADVYLKFQSNPRIEPKSFGLFWSMPFAESRLVRKNKTRYYFYPPNNGLYPFILDPNKPKGCEAFYRSMGTKRLTLKIFKNGKAKIERVSDPKCFYEFMNSKLIRFKPSKDHDEFKISYDYKGNPLAYRNITKKCNVAEFFYKEGLITRIVVNNDKNQTFDISYIACDELQPEAKTISEIKFPSGSTTFFKYGRVKDAKRNILLQNEETITTPFAKINRIEMNSAGTVSWLEWESNTGFIVADNGGEYAIRNPFLDPLNPDYKSKNFTVQRERWSETMDSTILYNKHGKKYPEIWGYDRNAAVKIVQNSNTGEKRRTSYIGAPGSTYMKSRKVEKKLPGQEIWQNEIYRVYDSDGRIIREIQPNALSVFSYDKNGTQIRENFSDGNLVSKVFSKNGNRIRSIYFSEDGKNLETIYGKRNGLNFIEIFENGKFVEAKSYYKNWDENTLAYAKSADGTESFYNYTEYGIELLTKSTDGKETLKLVDQNISRAVNVTSPTDILKWKKQQQNKE